MRLRSLIPITAVISLLAPASASANFVHTVMPGESLSSIAAADGLSVAELAAANGLSPDAQLVVGSTVSIPPQSASAVPPQSASTIPAATTGDGDSDADDAAPSSTTSVLPTTTSSASGSYVVQPGDTLSAIAARAGMSASELAAANGLDPNGVLPAGTVLQLSGSPSSVVPSQAPAVGTTITGRMTWFGGPDDPSAQGAPASGLGYLSNGMAYYNSGSLGNNWLIHFPWGQTMSMKQIDIGPAPWTGNPFDIAYSALPSTPYNESTWPNPTVTGTYLGP